MIIHKPFSVKSKPVRYAHRGPRCCNGLLSASDEVVIEIRVVKIRTPFRPPVIDPDPVSFVFSSEELDDRCVWQQELDRMPQDGFWVWKSRIG